MLIGLTPPAGQSNHFRAVRKLSELRRLKGVRHNCCQAGQRQNVHRIVMKDRHQAKDFVGPQIFEINIWDQLPGQVALPLHAKNLMFEIHEAATVESQLP